MKKLIVSVLFPCILLGYQPADPPRVTLQPEPVFWPAVIVGAAVVGGAGWVGIKIINKLLEIHEHQITNAPAAEIIFTWAEDDYPE